jgi:Flp pilus assembly pilin Flp
LRGTPGSSVEGEPPAGDTGSVESALNLAAHLRLARREDGQTMAEYAIVVGMITIAIVAVFASLSEGVRNAITAVTGSI